MKKLLILAALLCGAAQAETLATAPNAIGGQIRLMAERGSCSEGSRVVLLTSPSGEFVQGCWFLMEDKVYAAYSNGLKRLYSLEGFTLTNQPPAQPSKQRGQSL